MRQTHEYLSESESPGGKSGLHRRSPGLTHELQRAGRADEVVMTTSVEIRPNSSAQTG